MRKVMAMRAYRLLGSLLAGGLVAILLVPAAKADLVVNYRVDAGAFTQGCTALSGTNCSFSASNINGTGVSVVIQGADSNSPGTPSFSVTEGSVTRLTNTGTTSHTIEFLIGDNGFMFPTTPPNVSFQSNVGGTVSIGSAANALSFTSCIATNNASPNCGAGTIDTPALTPSITAKGSYNASNTITISSLSPPFGISEDLIVTLGRGGSINYSSSSNLSPIPEPASLGLFGAALVGLAAIRRRRKKV